MLPSGWGSALWDLGPLNTMADAATGDLAHPQSSVESDNQSVDAVTAELFRRQAAPSAPEEPAEGDTSDTSASILDEMDGETPEQEEQPAATEAEAEAGESEQTPAEDKAAEDEALSQEAEPKKTGKDKRIDKLVARAKAAEEAKAALESRLAQLESRLQQIAQQQPAAPAAVPTGDDPLADVQTPDALEKRRQMARQVKRTISEALEDNPDAEEIELGGKTYSRSELKRIRRDAEADLEEHIPARELWLRQRNESMQQAVKTFAWAKDINSAEMKLASALIQSMPYLARDPRAPWLIGLLVEGEKALRAKGEAAAKPAPAKAKATPPPVTTETAVPPRRSSPSAQARREAAAAGSFSTNTSTDAVANYLLKRELAKQAS